MTSNVNTEPCNKIHKKLPRLPNTQKKLSPSAKKTRKIRKLPQREILGTDFTNASSSNAITELLISQNISHQNRHILTELWGNPNQKPPILPIKIGSPKKAITPPIKPAEPKKTSPKPKKRYPIDTFELNVSIPPDLMKSSSQPIDKSILDTCQQ